MNTKLKKAYQEGGFSLIAQRAKDRLFRTQASWWICRDLREPIPQFDLPFQVRLSQTPQDQVIRYMKKKHYLSEEEFKVAKENGHWFLGLFVNHEVKGFCKCGFRKVYVYDARETLTFPEGVSFIYEYEVDESLRGEGVGKYVLTTALKMLAGGGWRYTFGHIPPKNIASLRVVESCGFRKVELIRFIEIVGFKWRSMKIDDLLRREVKNEPGLSH